MLYMHCAVSMRQTLEYLYRKCGRIILGTAIARYNRSVYSYLHVLPLRLLFQLRCAMLMYTLIRANRLPIFEGHFQHVRPDRTVGILWICSYL